MAALREHVSVAPIFKESDVLSVTESYMTESIILSCGTRSVSVIKVSLSYCFFPLAEKSRVSYVFVALFLHFPLDGLDLGGTRQFADKTIHRHGF